METTGGDNNIYPITNTTDNCRQQWSSILEKTDENNTCGLIYKKHQFLKKYGNGTYEAYTFDGLLISIIDVDLKQDIHLLKLQVSNSLQMSFLIEGEQLLKLSNTDNKITYESQECYLIQLPKTNLDLHFLKNTYYKEIRISMNNNFLEKHQIKESFDLETNYGLKNTQKNFSESICIKTQKLLSEMLSDTRKGLFKRLFLESKVLDLLALQMETKNKPLVKPIIDNKKILKKIYELEALIDHNLTKHFTIQELSRRIGINDSMLKKEFKRVFGQTIFEYTLNKRIDESKKLLSFSDKPIYEISEMVGYKNATHFSAAFKKSEGVTPKKYRDTKKK